MIMNKLAIQATGLPIADLFFVGHALEVELFKRGDVIQGAPVGTKLDLVYGVFDSLNVSNFLMITGAPGNNKDVGKVALVFNEHDLTEEEVESFANMIWHTLSLTVTLRCFISSTTGTQRFIEEYKKR